MNECTKGPTRHYVDPTYEQGAALFTQELPGPVVMLNLLRFREVADYATHPHLAPETDISGRQAFDLYYRHTQPYLQALGGSVIFLGDAEPFLVGPTEETWDVAMLVRHASLDAFLGMSNDPDCMEGGGHRTAALEDARLLPLWEVARPSG